MNKEKILIIEDDPSIVTGLEELLSGEGYRILSSRNGTDGFRLYREAAPDFIILDIMVPGMNGFDVCREIRKTDPSTPVLMLTAKSEEIDKVVGLELGADDYLTKPFGVKELLARIRSILRRSGAAADGKKDLSFGDVTIRLRTFSGEKSGKPFVLSLKEMDLLKMLMDHPNETVDRNTILDRVWGGYYDGTTRTLDQYIVKLRKKIETDPENPRHIITVHKVGYMFRDGQPGSA